MSDTATSLPKENTETALWLCVVAALWLQLYYSCIYGWRHGDYYSYGWYVPPLVFFFFARLRPLWTNAPPPAPARLGVVIPALLALCALLAVLRTLGRVDPSWTLPLWLQAGVVVTVTFITIHRIGGGNLALRFLPVIVFACSAIPLPSIIEKQIVTTLTDSVIAASIPILEWAGQPVQAVGDQIGRQGEVVHVTEGCSGIKSAQSFFMAALFFGELLKLKPSGRLWMIAGGICAAWALNVARASILAWIRFEEGEAAFETAHDVAGVLAFVVGAGVLLGLAHLLDSRTSGRKITRRQTKGRTA